MLMMIIRCYYCFIFIRLEIHFNPFSWSNTSCYFPSKEITTGVENYTFLINCRKHKRHMLQKRVRKRNGKSRRKDTLKGNWVREKKKTTVKRRKKLQEVLSRMPSVRFDMRSYHLPFFILIKIFKVNRWRWYILHWW